MKKLILICLGLITLASPAFAIDFGVGPQNENDTVFFNSTAKLEFIQGTTQHLEGSFIFNPENPSEGIKGVLRVDLQTLKTGIDKRDEHMRDNHLQTDKYPYAYFELLSADALLPLMASDSAYRIKAKGNFYIHGNFREIEPDLQIVRKKHSAGGEAFFVTAKFAINLDEYKIPRPKALFLKLAETVEIRVVFIGSSQFNSQPIELPDWSKLD